MRTLPQYGVIKTITTHYIDGGFVESHGRDVMGAFRTLFPSLVIRSDDLGRAMVDVSVRHTGQHESLVLENRDILAMANSTKTHNPR
jgi:hypothetical protein